MKNFILIIFTCFLVISCSKVSSEGPIEFNSKGWSSQKTPTGYGLSCTSCENQVMISIDIVPIDKSNKYTKSNTEFISYLLLEKDSFAEKMASDAVLGSKVEILESGKAKINNIDVFRYVFISNAGLNNTFDNTSIFIHNDHLIKITLNYYDGYFSKDDKRLVDNFYKSIKLTP